MTAHAPLAFLQNINGPEILLIFLVVLLLFGAKRLPELFRSFGKSIKEFKKATSDIEDDIRTAMDAEDQPRKKEAFPAEKAAEEAKPPLDAPAEKAPERGEDPAKKA
jgi:sec-independent protein translocase protein TatA